MFRNYLKIAFRSLLRAKGFTAINLLGLTLGTACSLYLLLYVFGQYRYDRHHEAAGRIFRVVTDNRGGAGNGVWHSATSSPPIAPAMEADFAEVEKAVRLMAGWSRHLIRFGDNSFFVEKGYYADSTFFSVFTYRFVEGSPGGALDHPYTVVLTRPVAERLFGREKALGKEVSIENDFGRAAFRVTGVVDAQALKSHIRGNFYMAMNSGGIGEYVRNDNHWAGNNFVHTYVKLVPGADPEALEAKLPAFLQQHGADQLRELDMQKTLSLEPVRNIHLYSDRENQVEPTVKASLVWILLTIAILIQVIACINFMNLSTARAGTRAREVSIRKIVGAGKRNLIGQFLGESVLITMLAFALALPLLNVLLPRLNGWFSIDVDFNLLKEVPVWLSFAAVALATGLFAGSYPAFYQSAFQPLKVMKGNLAVRGAAVGLRKTLVVFQFVVSIALMAGVLIISRQMNYIASKDLGFAREQRLVVPFRTDEAHRQMAVLKRELTRLPEVSGVSAAAVAPGEFIPYDFGIFTAGKDMSSSVNVRNVPVDEHYLRTLEIPLLAGRNFTPADTTRQIIVNEATLQALGIPTGEAPGQQVYAMRDGQRTAFEIIGVMHDFHFQSLRQAISPFMLLCDGGMGLSNLIVAYNGSSEERIIKKIRSAWQSLLPGVPFEYAFLDENLRTQYESDMALLSIIRAFTLIAVFVACLGLLGLSAFSAEQRVREIGIRKVLGAGVGQLVLMLSGDFLKLVLLAAVAGLPVAWWGMQRWLEDFAYRAPLDWWMLLPAGALAILIAAITISYQALRAANANPVDSLRS